MPERSHLSLTIVFCFFCVSLCLPSTSQAVSNSIFETLLGTNAITDHSPTKKPDGSKTSTQLHSNALISTTKEEEGVHRQLKELADDIERRKAEINRLNIELRNTKHESEIELLQAEKKQKQSRLTAQEHSLEQIATGAVDLSQFRTTSNDDFSWQDELKAVFMPVLSELKKLTERPRQIEHLRNQKTSLSNRLTATKEAIAEIENLNRTIKDKKVKKSLNGLLKIWQDREQNIENQLRLITYKLNDKIHNTEDKRIVITKAFKNFFTGRGLNLLLATCAFVITFFIFKFFSRVLERWISRGQDKESRFFARLVHIVFQILTVLLSVFALMATLYSLGDWLILTLLVIMLVGIAFALRHSMPRYMGEVRLLLNLGSVREGERVIYNGLPWRISRLNIYSKLTNPLLTGGRIRLPISVMMKLVSRRWSREEYWFPCKPHECVILNDKVFGQVMIQTPESVHLQVPGGALKHYSTLDFLALSPLNLSEGFALYVTLALDYSLKASITSDIKLALARSIQESIDLGPFGKSLEGVTSEFEYINQSSLDLVIIAKFTGDAAIDYPSINRFIYSAAIDATNRHDWTIPFKQLTVHLPTDRATTPEPCIDLPEAPS